MKTLCTLLLVLNCIILQAQTWTGSVNKDWNTAGNWNTGIVPTSSGYVVIPGTGITNWPELNSDILLTRLQLISGSQIDTKGFKIDVNGGEGLTILGAIIKNSSSGTDISIRSYRKGNIQNTIFEENTIIEFSGIYLKFAPTPDSFNEESNHFKKDVKFVETGDMSFSLSSVKSTYDANVEVTRLYPSYTGDPNFVPTGNYFFGGAAITGNFKYSSLYPAEIYLGFSTAGHLIDIAGNVDITLNGNLSTTNVAVAGTTSAKFIGSRNTKIYHYGVSPFNFTNLSVEKTSGATVTLQTPVLVAGTVSFVTGNIISSETNPLILSDDATTSGASNNSYVIGTVRKIGDDAFSFPVGRGTGLFPVSISAPSNITDVFSASFESSTTSAGYNPESKDASLYKVSTGGYWDIKRVTGSSAVKVILQFTNQFGSITNLNELRVAHWNGASWENLGNGGTTGNITSGSVSTALNVSSFSPFTLASGDASNPLPVKLVHFEVLKTELSALLKWKTSEELQSDRFDIEHASDALTWQKIGETKAAGQSGSISEYSFKHEEPLQGVNYYRLKMIDTDGTFAYSKILKQNFSEEKSKIVLYPNPVADKIFIQAPKGISIAKIDFFDTRGRLLRSLSTQNLNSGIDLSKIEPGIYVLNLNLSNGLTESHKVIVGK